jgi:hypothetical protein
MASPQTGIFALATGSHPDIIQSVDDLAALAGGIVE